MKEIKHIENNMVTDFYSALIETHLWKMEKMNWNEKLVLSLTNTQKLAVLIDFASLFRFFCHIFISIQT